MGCGFELNAKENSALLLSKKKKEKERNPIKTKKCMLVFKVWLNYFKLWEETATYLVIKNIKATSFLSLLFHNGRSRLA